MNHLEIIQIHREALNLSHDEAAAYIGINAAWYWDVESYEDELLTTLDLSHIVKLCQLLQISPRYLLACPPSVPVRQAEELKQLIDNYCQNTSTRINDFEEKAGWKVNPFLANPDREFQTWCLDELKDVCAAVGVNYMEFIPD